MPDEGQADVPASAEPVWIRAFLAADLGAGIRDGLAGVVARLKRSPARVGWVPAENLHITLLFLGDIPAEVGGLAQALGGACGTVEPFEIEIAGLGTFGAPRRPRIVWAGVAEGGERLGVLAANLRAVVSEHGIRTDERAFHPHVTLGRVRPAAATGELLERLERMGHPAFGRVVVDRVLLMRSDLSAAGPRYPVLRQLSLGAA